MRLTKLPIWFDEGAAMQVDYREQYNLDYGSIGSAEIERVDGLFGVREFFSGGPDEIQRNYQIAKAIVGHRFLQDANQSLYSMLTRLKKMEKILSVHTYLQTNKTMNVDLKKLKAVPFNAPPLVARRNTDGKFGWVRGTDAPRHYRPFLQSILVCPW